MELRRKVFTMVDFRKNSSKQQIVPYLVYTFYILLSTFCLIGFINSRP
jgi:hypothetical protein